MWEAAMARARLEGHEVRILASDYRDSDARGEDDADVYRTLRWYWDLRRYEFPKLSVAERLVLERHNAAELARHMCEFRPDVISWWSMGCMSLSLIERVRRAGLTAVFNVHDDWLVYGPEYDQWIRLWRGRRVRLASLAERLSGIPTKLDLSRAGRFVFNSHYTLARGLATGLSGDSCTVVYPGIDERSLKPLPSQPWRWRLAYVGRIDRQKGIDTAIRALARLPRVASLSIWGTGDDRHIEELRRLAEAVGAGGRVRFEGWAGAEQLRAVYGGADAIVFPVRWEEPFGLVPLEAMAVGRPVVGTARGGTAEFVRDGENALVFSADDELGLAQAIRRLAQDERLRQRLRDGGKRTAAGHTIARFATRTVEEIVRAADHAAGCAVGARA